jgi:hypothetical protein
MHMRRRARVPPYSPTPQGEQHDRQHHGECHQTGHEREKETRRPGGGKLKRRDENARDGVKNRGNQDGDAEPDHAVASRRVSGSRSA